MFLKRLQRSSCLLLHLSEGVDQNARKHFKALELENGLWAITNSLAGIHCVGLTMDDFRIMKENGGSVIWSPLSNFLLYGKTANIRAAKLHNLLIGIGPDWSPSGSKNLLGELKIARLVSEELGGLFTDYEIMAMATTNAARILKWDKVLGSIEAKKRADLLVISGRKGDPYKRFFKSRESSMSLVVINGIPRYGQTRLMKHFGDGTENWRVGRAKRILNLKQETADPVVGALTLKEAQSCLKEGLQRLPALAHTLERPAVALTHTPFESAGTKWYLVLDHNELEGETHRHHLPFGDDNKLTGHIVMPAARLPLSQVLVPIELDALAVRDDTHFLDLIVQQKNLPDFIKNGLPDLY